MLDNIVAIITILLSAVALYFSLKKQGREERNIDADTISKLFNTIKEQEAITYYLDNKTQKIDSIIINIKTQIATLKELRKTLINDVVTGKIRVVD